MADCAAEQAIPGPAASKVDVAGRQAIESTRGDDMRETTSRRGGLRALLAAWCGLAACVTAQAGEAFDYRTLWVDGSVSTSPTGINEDGAIVGSYQLERGPDLLVRPFTWKDGVYTVYEEGDPASLSFDDVNDARHIVINLGRRDFTTDAYFGNRHHKRRIAVPGAVATHAYALSDRDLVVGGYEHDPNQFGILATSAFAWSKADGYLGFDAPGAAGLTIAWGVNAAGTMVGVYMDAGAIYHGFVRGPDGTVRTVDVAGSPYTQLMGINEGGDIVGFYQDPADFILRGFVLHPDGRFVVVAPPDSTNGSYPYRITDDGRIVGWYLDANYRTMGFLATPR
jgi:hypothetical protein